MTGPSLRDRLGSAPARLGVAAADRAVHAFARLRYAMPDVQPRRHHMRVDRDVSYGPRADRYHRLDVYIPVRQAVPMPVVMYVHGGAFAMLSKETHRVMAMAIARAGYLVFNINYRQGPAHRYPAPLEDAALALLWVQRNCGRWGGDTRRIALAGESAGANLVTALAVASSWRRPELFAASVFDAQVPIRAVLATYGFLDLAYTSEYLKHPRMSRWVKWLVRDAARSYIGGDLARAVDACPLASPLRIIEAGNPDRPLPPFFASVGTKDPLLRCSKRLKAALDALSTPCELAIAPGEIHGYDAFLWRPTAQAKWAAAHDFLRDHLGAPPASGAPEDDPDVSDDDPRDARRAV